jgi:hypothetical protein
VVGNSNSGRKAGFRHNENTRSRIRAAHILRRFDVEFDRKPNSKTPELTDNQIKIGFGLLRKVLPDLQSIVLAGDADNPVVTRIIEEIVDPVDKTPKR